MEDSQSCIASISLLRDSYDSKLMEEACFLLRRDFPCYGKWFLEGGSRKKVLGKRVLTEADLQGIIHAKKKDAIKQEVLGWYAFLACGAWKNMLMERESCCAASEKGLMKACFPCSWYVSAKDFCFSRGLGLVFL